MQNLDWNKCFQRVSDAGLHFPLLFPSSGWHVFVFPLVRPPRTTGEARPPPLSFRGLMHLAEVDEGRYQYQIRCEKKPHHIKLDSRFACNAFHTCGETERAKMSACRRQDDRTTLTWAYQTFFKGPKIKKIEPAVLLGSERESMMNDQWFILITN